jgi:uncharacterized membrane protein YeaQ/YmgE (transglycosylase-associated protein family)
MNLEMSAMLVLVGLLTGWLAGFVTKDGTRVLTWDLALGLVGSTVAGELFVVLGLAFDAGILVAAGVAFAGAAIVIVAQRQVWPVRA